MSLNSRPLAAKPLTTAPASISGVWLSSRRMLGLVILLAVVLRVASALYQGDVVNTLPGIYDQVSYDGLARRLLQGHGFSFGEAHWPATRANEPTAHWSYSYTLYLTGIYALFGLHPLVARVLQAVLVGVLHSWLIWRLGRRLFQPGVAVLASALSAVYIYFFYYAGALITESFYIVSILWSFDVALRLAGYPLDAGSTVSPLRRHSFTWVEFGLAIGATVLLRQLFMLFVPFLFGWVWWNRRQAVTASRPSWPARLWAHGAGFLVTVAVVAALILPWTIRNYRAFGVFTPLNTNSGFAFFWGNHPIYGTHFVGILPADGPSYQDLIPTELLDLNEAELDQALLRRGVDFVLADPQRYLLLSISRFSEYFKFWPTAESGAISNIARAGSFGLALPFILCGLALALRALWRPPAGRQRAALLLLYMFMLVYTGIHVLTWTLIRYRLPVDAFLLLFAAYAIWTLSRCVWRAIVSQV